MAIRKKGARRIVVDGEPYLWRVRQKPSYIQGLGWTSLTVAVQHATASGTTLVGRVRRPRLDNWGELPSAPVIPSEVADLIRQAIAAGWQPRVPGKQFIL